MTSTLNIHHAVNSSAIIRLENICKVYGIGATTVQALNDVSLIIEEGEYCAIIFLVLENLQQ